MNAELSSLCIVGDVNVDIVSDLSSILAGDMAAISRAKHVAAPIRWMPGGTGVMMAAAARARGIRQVHLIAKLGSEPEDESRWDLAGRFVANWLREHQIELGVAPAKQSRTGTVVMLYFADDQRIMAADAGANRAFSSNDVGVDVQNAVCSADVLFVSGYALLVPERAAAVSSLMQLAHRHRRLVVLDVVPHHIYQEIDRAAFEMLLRHVHLLVSEVNTLDRLLLDRKDWTCCPSVDLATVWDRVSSFCPAALLRPCNDTQVLFDAAGKVDEVTTEYQRLPVLERRGYSERLTLDVLVRHYRRLAALAAAAQDRAP